MFPHIDSNVKDDRHSNLAIRYMITLDLGDQHEVLCRCKIILQL